MTDSELKPGEVSQFSPPRRNIELKARLASIDEAREIAKSVATEHLGSRTQIDTYFCCGQGRLKLRESEGAETPSAAQLVSYQRADVPDAKPSDYRLLDVAEPDALRQMLTESLGVECVVEKRRDVFMYQNVRIHLDEVTGLGTFLEFEAVLDGNMTDEQGQAQVAHLANTFRIADSDRLQGSYSDMVPRQEE